MSTVEYGDGRGRVARAFIRLGHLSAPLVPALFAGAAVRPLVTLWVDAGNVTGLVWAVAGWVYMLVLTLAVVSAVFHERLLCPRDVLPWLDPEAVVLRRRRWLWINHQKWIWWTALALILLFLGASLWPGSFVDGPLWLRIGLTVLTVVTYGALAVTALASYLHGQLGPWCPFCRRGGGGDDHSHAPSPDPAGAARG